MQYSNNYKRVALQNEILTFVDLHEIGNAAALSISASPFELATGLSANARTYWKEVAYEGDFVKRAGESEQRFRISKPLILHWEKTGKEMLADGIGIPMPLGHTKSPELKRAEVRDYKTGINASGKLALYALTQFKDEQSERDLKSSNVSLYMEPEAPNGKGKVYRTPITHIAFTDYPVLPGLEPFKPIAASFVDPQLLPELKDFNMPITLKELATKCPELKLAVDGKPEETINALCLALDSQLDVSTKLTADVAELQKKVTPPAEKKPSAPVSPMMLSLARDNRNMKIDALATAGKISAATVAELKKTFTADEPLTLALSNDGSAPSDNFNAVYSALELLPVSAALANSKPLPKDSDDSGENSPVAKAAERRAKAAAGR